MSMCLFVSWCVSFPCNFVAKVFFLLASRGFNINKVITNTAWKVCKERQVTGDRWYMTGEMWDMTHDIFFLLFCFGIGATIHTRWEIQCLPYVGLLVFNAGWTGKTGMANNYSCISVHKTKLNLSLITMLLPHLQYVLPGVTITVANGKIFR